MRAYVVASGQHIEPFGELARDLPIGNEPLHQIQRRLFERFGLTTVEVERLEDVPTDAPCLVTYDNVYFTRRVLKSFLQLWRARAGEAVQLALPEDSTFVRQFGDLQDFERRSPHVLFRFFGYPAGPRGSATPLEVIYRERILEVPVPHHVSPSLIWPHPLTSSVVFHVRHWLHLLEANRLSIQIRWIDEVVTKPWYTAWLLLRALPPWPGRGELLWRVLSSANRIHPTASVHPSARLEGCMIGPGARVGAQAFLRGVLVGEKATIEERANVAYSVIGPGCYVSKIASIYGSVGLAEGSLGMSMQLCVTGRRVVLTPRATPMDLNPSGPIRVKDGDRLVEVQHRILGAALGHGVFLGPDVFLAPGRAIPNGTIVGPHPGRVLSIVPADRAGRYSVIQGGTLVDPSSG